MHALQSSQVTILVKALPRPSKKYRETVCCAGLTNDGQWKRLFPIRYRHLSGELSFKRWDRVSFRFRRPHQDTRPESCHVFEDSIEVIGHLAERERERLLNSVIVASADQARRDGASLALIRPTNSRFRYRKKSESDVAQESDTYRRAAQQTSFFDRELAALKPTPYNFEFKFDDGNGSHVYQCGDWEVNAMFYNGLRRWGERQTLEWMEETFNVMYPSAGMVFALGNMASRPQTWQLLGVIRLDEPRQADLFG